jgi:DNA repair protein RadA/Sms
MQIDFGQDEVAFGTSVKNITVPERLRTRIPTGISYIDAAFGGRGLTPSVVTLFTGTSGAGKSTMMLNLAEGLTSRGGFSLYNTAEESAYQVALVAERIGLRGDVRMGQVNSAPHLLEKFDALVAKEGRGMHPFLVVDSLQTLHDGKFSTGRITSATSERVLEQLTSYAKQTYCNIFVIGQVTKSGRMAGTNKLKHMVDAHIHMMVVEDDESEFNKCRFLAVEKNRFGGAGFGSYLKLEERGFREVARLAED